jgi:hypothetical protein
MNDDTINTTDREDASDLQQWIDGLLRSGDAAELEAAPATTHVAATSAIKKFRTRRIRRHSLAVFASAAAAITAISLWAPPAPPDPVAPGSARGSNDQATVHRSATPGQRPGLQIVAPIARFVTNGEIIAIPLASDDPQVSIVKLYPTTTTERRWRRDTSLYARHTGQDGG